MLEFGESGHPIFRATSPLSKGVLKSKGGGKLSIHFCADGDTIETVFRTIISGLQKIQCKTFYDLVNVYVFDIASICVHGKELLRQFKFHQKKQVKIYFKQMFEISEKLTLEQSDEIFGVSQISWESSPWKQLSLVNDEEVISLSHAQVYVFSDSVLCLGKMNQSPISNTVWERQLERFKDSITIQNTGHNRRRTDGIRVEYFPRILNIGACPRSPKIHEQNGRSFTIQRTNYLHVDVQ